MGNPTQNKSNFLVSCKKDFKRNYFIYGMLFPVLLFYIIFHYGPMYGAQIAFKDFNTLAGIWGSPWIGFSNFSSFFESYYFTRLLRNTLILSVQSIVFTFPAPIILALLLNEIRQNKLKRFVQTITYFPHFISVVVISGIIINFVKQDGLITSILTLFNGANTNLLLEPGNFRPIYIVSDIWQHVGWNSIIYLAALASVDQELYEAAKIDGAGRVAQMMHITIPSILPTITILLILRIGAVMNIGFEKVMLLYNPTIYETADVISTFVYRRGILEVAYGYSAAVGLFNSAINCILVILTNQFSRRYSETSLW